jgi:hypothetical protein
MDTYTIIAITIGLMITVGTIIYFFFYYKSNPISKYELKFLSTETTFDENYESVKKLETMITDRKSLLIPSMGYGLTFVWEMYIPAMGGNDKWQSSYNRLKPIISMNDSPVIAYHPKKNYISVVLKYRDNPFYAQFAEVKFENVKVQGWNKYIIIIENRAVKIYINGALISTKILPSLPVIYDMNSEVVLGEKNNNFLGKVREVSMYPFPIPFDQISNL